MTSCIFCQIIEGKAASSKVYEDDICLAFLDIQPVNPGHILVVPKVHFKDLSDLPAAIGSHLFQVAQRISFCLPKTGIRSEGFDLFLADGEAAGQDVFHAHLHVFPRYAGDGFGLKLPAGYKNLPERSELDEIAKRLRTLL